MTSPTGAGGPVTVIPDVNCPDTLAYALQMDTWRLLSLGPVPNIFDKDGVTMLRVSNADSVEIRARAYMQLECNAPGWNGVVSLNASS